PKRELQLEDRLKVENKTQKCKVQASLFDTRISEVNLLNKNRVKEYCNSIILDHTPKSVSYPNEEQALLYQSLSPSNLSARQYCVGVHACIGLRYAKLALLTTHPGSTAKTTADLLYAHKGVLCPLPPTPTHRLTN
ncbi:hypothetical protein ACTXT7_016276, partial [Hymenolepis weldensis]